MEGGDCRAAQPLKVARRKVEILYTADHLLPTGRCSIDYVLWTGEYS